MEVHYGEGVPIRNGPEPCAGTREGDGEVSAGEHIGQPLSRESKIVPTRHRECPSDPAWSETLACVEAPCSATGRSRV